MKQIILGMSQKDSFIRDKLIADSEPMIEHLIKLMLYPNTEWCRGWRTEVRKFIPKVDKLKRTNKFPPEEFIMKAFSTHFDVLDTYAKVIVDDMEFDGCQVVPENVSNAEMLEKVTAYCRWLSIKLSTEGFVSNKEVHEVLESIGL